MDINQTQNPLQITIRPPAEGQSASPAQPGFFSGDSPTFKDVLDTINPLQHIPGVATAYQSATGDTPSVASKLLGGALFGGPIGFVASLFDTIIQNATGTDIVGNVMAAVTGQPVPALHTGDGATQTAGNTGGSPPDHFSANQRTNYNAYLQSQSLLA